MHTDGRMGCMLFRSVVLKINGRGHAGWGMRTFHDAPVISVSILDLRAENHEGKQEDVYPQCNQKSPPVGLMLAFQHFIERKELFLSLVSERPFLLFEIVFLPHYVVIDYQGNNEGYHR